MAFFASAFNLRLCLLASLILAPQFLPTISPALLVGLTHHHRNHHHPHRLSPLIETNQTECNLFVGNWVVDESYPLYQSSDCPIIDPEFNCQFYGRPDSNYLMYRWKPATCDLPSFDGLEFAERMRGRTVMFVGDSLGRNQWESLICMISSALPRSSATQITKGDPLSTFRILEYGVAISFYRAPYLVDIDIVQGKRILRLDEISGNGNAWRGVDVLSFNTGHWYTHRGSLQGWDYMESGGMLYEDMDRLSALDQGLRTWARWVDANVDPTRTRVFFQSISPTHYKYLSLPLSLSKPQPADASVFESRLVDPMAPVTSPSDLAYEPTQTIYFILPSDWSSGAVAIGKNCYGETTPATGISYPADGYPAAYAGQMRVLKTVLTEMSIPTYLLDITMLSAMRKDGHPSIYSGDLSPGQRANPGRSADCSHWCLPGLPDTWNQLFNTALFY
ncbi:hypothetical protein Cgig2_031461 [Carnegiea gigantea]|uniref:Trichome birefringence-like N-terminal domain-containing protein n=1 Tax=Carnegiea gigantea TaxID=171969 RepID=A0A9Q1K6U6_9CARY|nr:hypothetical protein Cgig2_031461 [Carnegiea gigantea]